MIIAVNFPISIGNFPIAQLVEQRTGNAEVTGSNPIEALIFFQASSFQLLKLENLLRWSFFTFNNDNDDDNNNNNNNNNK